MHGFTAQVATEDIERVLSRFQAWTGSRMPVLKDGVREISYEEALESSRSRWKGRNEIPPALLREEKEKMDAEELPPSKTGHASLSLPDLPPSEEPLRDSGPEISVLSPVAPTDTAPLPVRAPMKKAPRDKRSFQALLAQSVGGEKMGSSLARTWTGGERQVSMSLRVAVSEQALIKIRAAEAGVSASAYLRQCALEVEGLRAQVQQFLAFPARHRLATFGCAPMSTPPVRRTNWLSKLKTRVTEHMRRNAFGERKISL